MRIDRTKNKTLFYKTTMKLHPRVYVISLERTPERWERCVALNEGPLASIGLTLHKISAVDGQTLTDDMNARFTNLSAGERGCFLSHITAMYNCFHTIEDDEFVFICEDDAIFFNDETILKTFTKNIESIPDHTHVSFIHCSNKWMLPAVVQRDCVNESLQDPRFPMMGNQRVVVVDQKDEICENLWTFETDVTKQTFATHCTLHSKRSLFNILSVWFAQKTKEKGIKPIHHPFDHFINIIVHNTNGLDNTCRVFLPTLTYMDPIVSGSNIICDRDTDDAMKKIYNLKYEKK